MNTVLVRGNCGWLCEACQGWIVGRPQTQISLWLGGKQHPRLTGESASPGNATCDTGGVITIPLVCTLVTAMTLISAPGITGNFLEDASVKILQRVLFALPLVSGPAIAMDYTVDFSRIDNLESIRPLVQQCADFDALEIYRNKMETSTNLEELRSTLSSVGFALFNTCPDNISGPGITPVKQPEASQTMDYSVDFTRVLC